MAIEPTPVAPPVVVAPAAPVVPAAPAAPVAAVSADQSLLGKAAAPVIETPEQIAATATAKAESTARADAFTKADGKDAKLAAYQALTADEKAETFKAMPEEQRKELGVEDPAIPVYDMAKFTAPEGMKLDPEAIKPALELFKEARIPQEQAQKFLDLALSREKAAADTTVKAFVDMQNKWVTEIKADPEIGGPKLDASLASANRAIDRLNIPGLKEALTYTGAGNNPAIVKAFVRLGAMLSEDKFAPGSAGPSAQKGSPNYYGDGGPKGPIDAAA